MFAISSFYKLPINDCRIRDMGMLEKAWTLQHINHHNEIETEVKTNALKLLCTVMNPELAEKIFKNEQEVVNVGFRDQLEEQLGKKLSDEEFEEIMNKSSDFDEVSSIEEEAN